MAALDVQRVVSIVRGTADQLAATSQLLTKQPSAKLIARVQKNTTQLRSLISVLATCNNTSYLGIQQPADGLLEAIAREAHQLQLAPQLARLALWLQQDAALETWGSSGHGVGALEWSRAAGGVGMLLLVMRNELKAAGDLRACERLAQQVGLEEGACGICQRPYLQS